MALSRAETLARYNQFLATKGKKIEDPEMLREMEEPFRRALNEGDIIALQYMHGEKQRVMLRVVRTGTQYIWAIEATETVRKGLWGNKGRQYSMKTGREFCAGLTPFISPATDEEIKAVREADEKRAGK